MQIKLQNIIDIVGWIVVSTCIVSIIVFLKLILQNNLLFGCATALFVVACFWKMWQNILKKFEKKELETLLEGEKND